MLPYEITDQAGVSSISSRPFRTNSILTKKVNSTLDSYLGAGLIQHSSFPWALPLVVVPERDGIIRIAVNYEGLNHVTVVKKNLLPRTDEVLDSSGEGKILSTFDLASGFPRNAIYPDTVPLTAFQGSDK